VFLFLVVATSPALGIQYFIPTDTSIGIWDPVSRTYTLTTDISDPSPWPEPGLIEIVEDNLTLDGAGHTRRRDRLEFRGKKDLCL